MRRGHVVSLKWSAGRGVVSLYDCLASHTYSIPEVQ